MKSFLVGIGGGTGAGKTTLAGKLVARLGAARVVVLQHDDYYRDLSSLAPAARGAVNFDALEALETELLVEHLHALRGGQSILAPVYDFGSHTRLDDWRVLTPRELVLLEGTLVLADPALRNLLDLRVYVDAPRPTRLARRLTRDVAERGRDVSSCLEQHWQRVWPMHDVFVEPSLHHADVVVTGDAISAEVVASLAERIDKSVSAAKSAAA